MSSKEINEIARKDHRTMDTEYNRGLKCVKELGIELSYHKDCVKYWMSCNNLSF